MKTNTARMLSGTLLSLAISGYGLMVVMLSGCMMSTSRLSLVEARPAETTVAPSVVRQPGERIEGSACMHIAVFVPVGGPVTLEDAVADALKESGSNVIRHAEVDRFNFYIPYLYGRNCWIVRGESDRGGN